MTAPSDVSAGDVDVAEPQESARMPRVSGMGAATWSQFFIRTASTAGLLVIGGYLVALRERGNNVTPVVIGAVVVVAALFELILAPVAGALSDRHGRKPFLLAGPGLSALAVLLPPLGGLGAALPPLGLALGLVTTMRVIQGASGALSSPATLGLLAEGTDAQPVRRGRQMSFYELASSGGIALGAALGPLLWERLHVGAFLVLSLLYAIATFLVLRVHDAASTGRGFAPRDLRRALGILAHRHLRFFAIGWIGAAAILGVWITAQIEFLLTAHIHAHGQRFVGSLHGRAGLLSAYLGAFVVWFTLCVLIWSLVLGRLPKPPVLVITVSGSIFTSAALVAINHGVRPLPLLPVILAGIFLEAGFAPAALAYLADLSQSFAHDRGLMMGLYSIILGLGQFLGNGLGALFAQALYFDGLALLTVLLAAVTMVSMGLLHLQVRDESLPSGEAPGQL
jgi:MFS family permease